MTATTREAAGRDDGRMLMGKSEEKRAAILAQQAARELAARESRRAAGTEPAPRKMRTNWAASPPLNRGPRRGRPPKPTE
jgi:hypothetical protein